MATGELFPLAEASGSFSLRVPCPVHHPPNPPPGLFPEGTWVSQILPDGALRLLAPARFKKPALLPPRSRFPKDTTRRQRQGPAFYLRGAAFPPPPRVRGAATRLPRPTERGSARRNAARRRGCFTLGVIDIGSASLRRSWGSCPSIHLRTVLVFVLWLCFVFGFFFFSQINTRFKRPRSNNNFLKKSSLVGFGGQGEE